MTTITYRYTNWKTDMYPKPCYVEGNDKCFIVDAVVEKVDFSQQYIAEHRDARRRLSPPEYIVL